MKKIAFLVTPILIALAGCTAWPVKSPHHEPGNDAGGHSDHGDGAMGAIELRKIDKETREKLGLKPNDALLAVVGGDDPKEDKTILFIDDTAKAQQGDFIPGRKLVQVIQIYAFRDSPKCYYISGVAGKPGYWTPVPDCPHPPR